MTDEDLPASEAARARRRDRDMDAERRALLRPGMAKVFRQVTEAAAKPPKRKHQKAQPAKQPTTGPATGHGAESSEYPDGLGNVARRELARNGYTRYDQLTAVTAAQLRMIHGVGPKAIRILDEELKTRGMSFSA